MYKEEYAVPIIQAQAVKTDLANIEAKVNEGRRGGIGGEREIFVEAS